MNHLYVVPIILELAGRDAWLSPLLLLLTGIITVLIYSELGRIMPDLSLMEIPCKLLGRFIGKMVCLLYILYFLIPPAITLRGLMGFMTISFMPYTPPYIFGFCFLLICTYAVFIGFEGIVRANEILFPLLVFTGLIFSVMTSPEKNYQRLYPILEKGFYPVLHGSTPLLALLGELVVICMFIPTIKQSISLRITNVIIIISIFILLIGPLTGTIAVHGIELASRLHYPTYSELDCIQASGVIENLRGAAVYIWTLGIFGRVSLYYYASVIGTTKLLGLTDYRKTVWPIGVIILILSLFLFPDTLMIKRFIEHGYTYISICVGIIFPAIFLIIALLKKKLN